MRDDYQKMLDRTADEMTRYYSGDPARIGHFLKVHSLAARIGREEGLPEDTQFILELAALTHDIEIKAALEVYGSAAGKYQEFEGPGLAGEMLSDIGVDPDRIDRVCWLISRHHTYVDIDDNMDYRILVESDALVNIGEENWSPEAVAGFREKVFDTDTGKRILTEIYPD